MKYIIRTLVGILYIPYCALFIIGFILTGCILPIALFIEFVKTGNASSEIMYWYFGTFEPANLIDELSRKNLI